MSCRGLRERGDCMLSVRNDSACAVGKFGKAIPSTWRFVEQNFHNDNRLSWWLSHLSSPLDR